MNKQLFKFIQLLKICTIFTNSLPWRTCSHGEVDAVCVAAQAAAAGTYEHG